MKLNMSVYYQHCKCSGHAGENDNVRIEQEGSKIISNISDERHRKGSSLKTYNFILIKKLAKCRVNGFKDNQLDDLLTEIINELHRKI
jgi:hypothetical protein